MKDDFINRDIISITDFSREEILYLCQQATLMRDLEKSGRRYALKDKLPHKMLAYMFYEPSTRTKSSFITGMSELGGTVDGFSGIEGTSVMKKETIRDTVMMMNANHADVIVMRNSYDGSVQWAADVSSIPVINGGDGRNEHPTQALLDMVTLFTYRKGNLDGLSIGFGGDLSHGRTVRSLCLALANFKNITIRWAAEDFLAMPQDLLDLLNAKGITVYREQTVKDVMGNVEFFYMTRPQLERMKGEISPDEVKHLMQTYRIDLEKIQHFQGKLLHPLPVDSEIEEIHYSAYFHPSQGFFLQAENGVFLRKALLYEMLHHDRMITFSGLLHPSLQSGNNKVKRTIQGQSKGERFIDNIQEGVVIDHLQPGKGKTVALQLDLVSRGFSSIVAYLAHTKKSFLKTNCAELTDRELKKIAIISPEATINYIRNGQVSEKFVYLLCENKNCITRVLNEDVPPKFYFDGHIRCRYCRHPYTLINKKMTPEDRDIYIQSLPRYVAST